MAIAPTLVVAGHSEAARKLRDTGRFPVVFEVASASELRDLSKNGKVGSPVAFVFAPEFAEDVPGAEVAVLANGLVRNGYTVVVHVFFIERGDVFDPKVVMAAKQMNMAELLVTLGVLEPELQPELQPEPPPEPWTAPGSPPALPMSGHRALPRTAIGAEAAPRPLPVDAGRRQGWPETPPVNAGAAATYAPAGGPIRRAPAGPGQVIAIASAKGGVGKTSTTVNLAVHAARLLQNAGRAGSAVIVDVNFERADVARHLDLKSPTVLDLIEAPWTPSAQEVRQNLANIPEIDLYALLAPQDVVSVDFSTIDSLYRRILTVLRQTFDFVFIDTPVAVLNHRTFLDLVLLEADTVLVPVEPDRVTLEAIRSWLSAIITPTRQGGNEISPEKIFMILNRAGSDVECGPKEVMDQLGNWRFAGLIPEDEGWMRAVNNNRLTSERLGPDLERTLQGILGAINDDPVFAMSQRDRSNMPLSGRWKKLFPLKLR